MRYTGQTIQRALRACVSAHREAPSAETALQVAKLRALRALYETSVHVRIDLPGGTHSQRPLREVTEMVRLLRRMGWPTRALRAVIAEGRKVPMDLPDINFTA